MKHDAEQLHLSPHELYLRWRRRITVETLKNWRSQGKGPIYFKPGGRVLYPLSAVIKYERERLMRAPDVRAASGED
ncbi:MAG: hypothetical protein H6Q00_3551 [Holophagaceae bacterium]|nr:hypothetical protein [Holophagaceae bacterium]